MRDGEHDVEILLVEDGPEDAELTIRVLREQQLANKLVWVKNGAAALDFVFCRGVYAQRKRDEGPRLVLLDLNLPKVSGLEVLRQLQADPHARTIPVVVLSSSIRDKDILRTHEVGVNSYVSKPVQFEELLNAVRRLGIHWTLVNKPLNAD